MFDRKKCSPEDSDNPYSCMDDDIIIDIARIINREMNAEIDLKQCPRVVQQQICEKLKSKCVGVQFALNVEGNKAARFIIERIKDNADTVADALITIFVPFESSIPILPNGITFVVDTSEPFTEQFLFCDQLGCTSQFGLTKQGIDLLVKGANLSMVMIDIRNPNNKFIVDIDLENFETLYNNITSK